MASSSESSPPPPPPPSTTATNNDESSYWGIVRNGVPSILNNAAAPTALLFNLMIFSNAGGQEYMAAWAVIQSTVAFAQGMFNFLLYVPMAQIAHSVGQKQSFGAIKQRVIFALLTGIILGITCTICLCWSILNVQGWSCVFSTHLFGGRGEEQQDNNNNKNNKNDCQHNGIILELMNVSTSVRPLAILYLLGRIPSILLVFVNRVCTGILVGKQRIRFVTLINIVTSLLDVIGNAIVLLGMKNNGTIYQAGFATSVATMIGILIILPSSIYLKPPTTTKGEDKEELNTTKGDDNHHHPSTNTTDDSTSVVVPRIDEEEHPTKSSSSSSSFSVLEFVSSSLNMIVRSILLQGAMYTLSILASRIGTPQLAAHQVIIQIWSLVSFCCDGFADVGTMVGGRLLGEGQHKDVMTLTQRLLIFAVIAGTICGTILLLFQQSIISSFTHQHQDEDEDELIDTTRSQQVLQSVWLLTAVMQPINALVFVSDGLLFAHQAFGFIRNLMLIGVLGIFLPSLCLGYWTVHTLFALWVSKSLLSTWRCLAAFLFLCWSYQPKDHHSSSSLYDTTKTKEAEEENGNDDNHPPPQVATETSRLLPA